MGNCFGKKETTSDGAQKKEEQEKNEKLVTGAQSEEKQENEKLVTGAQSEEKQEQVEKKEEGHHEEHRKTLEEATAETEELWHKYREDVDRHGKLMHEYFDKAHKAHDDDDGAAAKEFSTKGKEEQRLMKEAQKKAAKAIFAAKNKEQPEGTIDLHGLLVAEAVHIVEDQLEDAKKKGWKELHIITGAGHHSGKGGPKIKPSVHKFLNEHKYKWETDESNKAGGSLTVHL
jgi:DNA-nicking Smr family endonuclease